MPVPSKVTPPASPAKPAVIMVAAAESEPAPEPAQEPVPAPIAVVESEPIHSVEDPQESIISEHQDSASTLDRSDPSEETAAAPTANGDSTNRVTPGLNDSAAQALANGAGPNINVEAAKQDEQTPATPPPQDSPSLLSPIHSQLSASNASMASTNSVGDWV